MVTCSRQLGWKCGDCLELRIKSRECWRCLKVQDHAHSYDNSTENNSMVVDCISMFVNSINSSSTSQQHFQTLRLLPHHTGHQWSDLCSMARCVHKAKSTLKKCLCSSYAISSNNKIFINSSFIILHACLSKNKKCSFKMQTVVKYLALCSQEKENLIHCTYACTHECMCICTHSSFMFEE